MGDIPGFFPSLLDPILPISLAMLQEEDPGVVAALFHAARSSLVIAAAEGGRGSYGFAIGARRATGVVVLECMAAESPSRRLILAVVLDDNLNGPAVRSPTAESVDSCSTAHRLDRLYLPAASAPLRVPEYRNFRQPISQGTESQFLAKAPIDCLGHSRRRRTGHHSGSDLRVRSTPVGFDDIARAMAMMLFSECGRSYWNVQRMIDFAMSFFMSTDPCS